MLGDKFHNGDRRPENVKVVKFHSSMEDISAKTMILACLEKPPEECSIRVVFASVALGMGAELRHVKHLIHAGPPSSLEIYVQGIGRAGRVGTRAKAILYYNNNDLAIKPVKANMNEYCKTEKCRREFVNEHFGLFETDKPSVHCNKCRYELGLEWDFSQLSIFGTKQLKLDYSL